MGLGGAVLFASGFGEIEEGHSYSDALDEAAGDMPYIGPNCYGFINFFDRVALWPDQAVGRVQERGTAIISQSGTISITLMGQRRSLPVGYVISLGNQQRLAAEDLIRYCAQDSRVSAIGLYLESIKNVPAFILAVDEARRLKKPVALVKAGRSKKGQELALTHTGALAGQDALHDAFFERLGVARCEDLSTLVETLKVFHCFGPLPSNRIAVMGASGGDMAMIADSSKDHNLEFPPPPRPLKEQLRASVGERVLLDNPLDFQTATWFDLSKLNKMFETMFAADYAVTAFMVDPPDEEKSDTESFDSVIELMFEISSRHSMNTALLSSLPESLSNRMREKALASGVAPIQGLPEALQAFHHAARTSEVWSNWSLPRCMPIIEEEFQSRIITEHEAKQMLAGVGLSVPEGKLVSAAEAAEAAETLGFPVVLKVSSTELMHKTEQGAVALGLTSKRKVLEAVERMSALSKHFLVEKMVEDSVAEVLLGIRRDPQFGQTLVLGSGGIFTEMLEDAVPLLLPIDESMVRKTLSKLKICKLLGGWRGKPAGDTEALVHTVLAFAEFVENQFGILLDAEINPLAVRPRGRGVMLLDALIHLKEH